MKGKHNMSEQHFKDFFKNSMTAYSYHKVILDDQGIPCDYVFLEVNNEYENTMNLRASDIVGKRHQEVFAEEWQEADQLKKACLEALTIHKTKSIDLPNDVSQKWFRIRVVPVDTNYFFCVFIDVTKEYLQQQEIEGFLRTNLDMLCVADKYGNIIEVNQQFEGELGYDAKELEGKRILSFVHKDDLSKTINAIRDLKKNIPLVGFINRYRCKDGTYKYLEWHSQPQGNYMYASARDITKKIESEKEIKKNLLIKEKHLQLMRLNNISIKEFLNKSLEYVIEFTGSELGYIFLYNAIKEEFLLHSWSESVLKECMIKDSKRLYYLGKVGLWGEVVRQRKPVIVNDYMASLLKKNGMPKGHVQIKNFLSIPVYSDGEIVAVVGAANKKTDYNEEDVLNLELLMNTVWSQVERKKSEEALKKSVEKYRLLTEYASDMIWVYNLTQNRYTYISPSILQLRGYVPEEALNQSFEEIFTPESIIIIHDAISKGINDLVKNPEAPISYSTELQQICKDGKIIWVEDTTKYRYSAKGEIEIVGVGRNIEDRKKAEKEILYLSYHDQLTGIYNRRYYQEELKRIDEKKNYPITMVMADVNGLKLTNDAFGHVLGDKILISFANIIKRECRSGDIIARIGGDEFILLLPKTNTQQAGKIVDRIQNVLSNTIIDKVVLSVAFGWKTKYSDSENFDEVFKLAEDAMYRRKLLEGKSYKSDTIKLITKSLYEKSPVEKEHSENVSKLCSDIGHALGLHSEDISELSLTGILHDIGKIDIDENILSKPGKLTKAEYDIVKRHSEIGYQILSSVNEFAEIAEYILAQHERLDGKGYPKGLLAGDIPMKSKILMVADAYDDMTRNHSYREALQVAEAVKELQDNSGTQFDEYIVRIFIDKVLHEMYQLF